jgi:class 3 adenylate cyclase
VLFLARSAELPEANNAGMAVLGCMSGIGGVGILLLRRFSAAALGRVFPWLAVLVTTVGIGAVTGSVIFVGPRFGGGAVFFVEIAVVAFITHTRPWAIAFTTLMMIAFGISLLIVQPIASEQYFINVLATAVASGVILGGLAARLDESRRVEARAKSALRRFLAPEIADVVVSSSDELNAHQCEVGVLFVDLRGFSEFTNRVEAERTMQVLTEYYAAVGAVLQEHGATIGGFDGDGVMAFIGDPVPHDKPAHQTIRTAEAVAARLDPLVAEWSADGHCLGYGIGVTFGVATLGVVGFEGRYDYTAVGAVVNLASRLCGIASSGEIVIDGAIRDAASLTHVVSRGPAELKGFGMTPTFAVRRD